MGTASSTEIDYAPPLPWDRRRTTTRIIYAFTALVILLALLWLWPMIRILGPVLYWQRQALAYTVPTNTVVYSNDPRDVATLRSAGYATSWPFFTRGSYVIRPNPTFQALANAHSGAPAPVAPALFLHRRQSPSGTARITAVQYSAGSPGNPFDRVFLIPYLEPLGLPKRSVGASATGGMEIFLHPTDRITIFHGQPDPADSSHFTINVTINDVPMTIDGYLKDRDLLTLTPRTGKIATYSSLTRWSPTGAMLPEWLERIATPATQPAP